MTAIIASAIISCSTILGFGTVDMLTKRGRLTRGGRR